MQDSSQMNYTMIRSVVALLCILVSPLASLADITFSPNGNHLDVTITAPIVFSVSSPANSRFYYFNVENAYTADQANIASDSIGSAAMTLNASQSAALGALSGVIAPGSGIIGPRDMFFGWDFVTPQALAVGDTVTVSEGTRTIPNFISAGGILPDSVASSFDLILADFQGTQLSPAVSVAVPEPSAFAFLTLVGVAFAGWQWERKKRTI